MNCTYIVPNPTPERMRLPAAIAPPRASKRKAPIAVESPVHFGRRACAALGLLLSRLPRACSLGLCAGLLATLCGLLAGPFLASFFQGSQPSRVEVPAEASPSLALLFQPSAAPQPLAPPQQQQQQQHQHQQQPPRHCAPRFLRYLPSALEVSWGKHVAAPGEPLNQRLLCRDIVSDAFFEPFAYWVSTAAQQNAERPGAQRGLDAQSAALASRDDVFSRLAFEDPCSGSTWEARVAPLAGMLRDPRGPCLFASGEFVKRPLLPMLSGGGEMLQVKDTVVVDAAHFGRVRDRLRAHGGRAILMDAGASTYQQGVVAGEWPGTRWLVERFRDQGINFTDIFCWEVTPHPGSEFFDGMSPELIAATRFYNFPVTAEAGPASPISVLKATARPGDFVVFKLDIDHPSTEAPLVEALLSDPEALALIDTFYCAWMGWGRHLGGRFALGGCPRLPLLTNTCTSAPPFPPRPWQMSFTLG
jgi:hypothetical protein